MRFKTILLVFLCTLFSPALNALAGWTGPTEVVAGRWGDDFGQFAFERGETSDAFPTIFAVSPDGEVAISEEPLLDRVQIFSSSGTLKDVIETPAYALTYDSKGDLFLAGQKLLKKFSPSGDLVWEKAATSFSELYVLDTGDVIAFDEDLNTYSRYQSNGTLISTSTSRPLELGIVDKHSLDSMDEITVQYPDRTFRFKGLYDTYVRDNSGNLNAIADKSVNKIDVYGKVIGRLSIPEGILGPPEVFNMETLPEFAAEYGNPVIAPNGDVYTWKKTESAYSIVKWTWRGGPAQ